jgi:hypothetical protein
MGVLMPFARAIQCLESKDATPADVYTYYLGITAHLKELFERKPHKYTLQEQGAIRRITNKRFSQLIESHHAGNIYLVSFSLDPGALTACKLIDFDY